MTRAEKRAKPRAPRGPVPWGHFVRKNKETLRELAAACGERDRQRQDREQAQVNALGRAFRGTERATNRRIARAFAVQDKEASA